MLSNRVIKPKQCIAMLEIIKITKQKYNITNVVFQRLQLNKNLVIYVLIQGRHSNASIHWCVTNSRLCDLNRIFLSCLF